MDKKNRIFLRAIQEKDLDTIRKLLEEGADPNAKSEEGVSALTVAIWGSDVDTVRTLLEAGADFDPKEYVGGAKLLLAASGLEAGDPDEKGPSISRPNLRGKENTKYVTIPLDDTYHAHEEIMRIITEWKLKNQQQE